MEHRGIRYAIRVGIARDQWRVAVYLAYKELPEERTVVGTRQDAEIAARSMIDAWLKKRLRDPPAISFFWTSELNNLRRISNYHRRGS